MLKARQKMMRLYHMGAGAMERSTGIDRHDWLLTAVGKSSSKDCSDAELANAIDMLKNHGHIQLRAKKTSQQQTPITANQWYAMEAVGSGCT